MLPPAAELDQSLPLIPVDGGYTILALFYESLEGTARSVGKW
jgi:hypothetical protein